MFKNTALKLKKKQKMFFRIITVLFIAQTNGGEMTDKCFVSASKPGFETT